MKRLCLICFENEGLKQHDYMCPACWRRAVKANLSAELIQEEAELDSFIADLIQTVEFTEK